MEMRLDGEARDDRVERCVRLDPGGIDVEFLAPDEPRGDAVFDDRGEEAPEPLEAEAIADARQAGMVGQRLGQVIADAALRAPAAQAKAVTDDTHQLALGADTLEAHHQLEFIPSDTLPRL